MARCRCLSPRLKRTWSMRAPFYGGLRIGLRFGRPSGLWPCGGGWGGGLGLGAFGRGG